MDHLDDNLNNHKLSSNLSSNFQLGEFCVSSHATKQQVASHLKPRHIKRLKRLCRTYLEPLRKALGNKPIKITSGFRPQFINDKIGGAQNSYHLKAQAADIYHECGPQHLYDAINAMFTVEELILYDGHVHIAYAQ